LLWGALLGIGVAQNDSVGWWFIEMIEKMCFGKRFWIKRLEKVEKVAKVEKVERLEKVGKGWRRLEKVAAP
jgi:hypothetical protein